MKKVFTDELLIDFRKKYGSIFMNKNPYKGVHFRG
jgi:hypothetical protein